MFDPAGLGKKAPMHNLLIRQLTSLLYTHAGNSIVIPAQDYWDRCCPQGHCKSGQRCWRNGGLLGRERVRAGPGCPVTPNHKQIHLTLPVEHARPRRLTRVAPKKPFHTSPPSLGKVFFNMQTRCLCDAKAHKSIP